jgi:hypothetical protein
MLDPVRFMLLAIAGWMNQRQQQTIEYLREENWVLRDQLGNHRLGVSSSSHLCKLSIKLTEGRSSFMAFLSPRFTFGGREALPTS